VTYAALLADLFARRRFGVRPGLMPIRAALDALGAPDRRLDVVHIAGTNGKGSTAAFVDAILCAAGRKTGLYTSPHLHRFTERIRIGGQELAPEAAAELGARVLASAPELTFFEVVTAMALVAFAEARVDVAILETGLGGRLDATNVVEKPRVTAITNVALDHVDILGGTIEDIAREKAGIVKPGVPVVVGRMAPEARAVIDARAREVGAPVIEAGPTADCKLGLAGEHQQRNAAVAAAIVRALPQALGADERAIATGLRDAKWPGRLEQIAPDLWIDGAHNLDGAQALASALPAITAGRPLAIVLGVVDDKDAVGMLGALMPHAARVILTRPPSPRALDPGELGARVPDSKLQVIADPIAATAEARRMCPVTLVAGSLFLVGAVRAAVLGEPADEVTVQDPMMPRKL
jgi:dihydrofolate synthase/folylpolyglutamate synthase